MTLLDRPEMFCDGLCRELAIKCGDEVMKDGALETDGFGFINTGKRKGAEKIGEVLERRRNMPLRINVAAYAEKCFRHFT